MADRELRMIELIVAPCLNKIEKGSSFSGFPCGYMLEDSATRTEAMFCCDGQYLIFTPQTPVHVILL